jgi:hypothetical protein
LPFESVAIGALAFSRASPATASGQGSRRCQTKLRWSRSAADRAIEAEARKQRFERGAMEHVELQPCRRVARRRLHRALHRRLVAGAPGVGERRPVDAPAFRRRHRLAFLDDGAAPVDDSAEDVEDQRADGAGVGRGRARRRAHGSPLSAKVRLIGALIVQLLGGLSRPDAAGFRI